ncbi:MAG: polyprenyl diphosphate synthase [Peptoniphilaceae bacterium]|nr:polyprenyl diphosphate synthase [Peptoniphilaceae bacterium]MDY6146087.1 polyprenyl diphosphate synthase [Peptoniphilaceae bacterium]
MEKLEKVPRHLGIILDGNGRWALQRGLPRTEGHRRGSENVISITRECNRLGVEVLSLYAFSTENWKRSVEEVSALMQLLIQFVKDYLPELMEKNSRLHIMGDIERLPFATKQAVKYALIKSEKNTGMVLNIGLNYGGQDEILRAFRRAAKSGMKAEDLNPENFERFLDTSSFPPVDLMIRTGGEKRISNFMIWQNAYSEFVFSDSLWPDFSIEELHCAFQEYAHRNRRFGGVQ